jgi:hypothetical protein
MNIREILAEREETSKLIIQKTAEWVNKIQDILKFQNLEIDPDLIKYERQTYDSDRNICLQQMIRLEKSYHSGLYHGYDNKELDFTNNATEQHFNSIKSRFRSLLGRKNIGTAFEHHGGQYSMISDIDYLSADISEILIKFEHALLEGFNEDKFNVSIEPRRSWHIRTVSTGNYEKLIKNMIEVQN